VSDALGTRPGHALLRPEIALPFLAVALIWGSTWFVIKDGLALVPPSWSVAYRFGIATIGMFALAAWSNRRIGRRGFSMTWSGHVLAVFLGLFQFFGNFNFVYRAEVHLTSGIVAVLFGLLMVPNAIGGRLLLGQPITRRFVVGSLIGIAGIALLLVHEAASAPPSGQVGLGVAFCAGAILSASAANVLQATETAKRRPLHLLLAWAMLWGTAANVTLAWLLSGPPVLPANPRYWAGVAYLALIGSVVTFPLYFRLIRDLGPGRAAYNGVMVPVVAMALSTLFEGYRWSTMAAAGAGLAMIGLVVALRGRAAPMRQPPVEMQARSPLR
jgi:drug/metabolite transporter (DMT)-like permease